MWLAAEVEGEREGSLVWGREKVRGLCGNEGCKAVMWGMSCGQLGNRWVG